MTIARLDKINSVLARRQPDLTVVMENVQKPHNLSAIIRTCDAIGIFQVHAVSDQPAVKPSKRSACGSGKWVAIRSHHSITEAYRYLKGKGFNLLAADVRDSAEDFHAFDYTKPTAIVVGAELDGISEAALARADQCIKIPLAGMVESLNVSVAAALILFEAKRQREEAGMYEHLRLDAETYRRLLFEWCYPRVAAHLRRKGIPYPQMNGDGEIMKPSSGLSMRV